MQLSPSIFSTRKFLSIGLVLSSTLVGFVFWSRHISTASLSAPLTITAAGRVLQNGKTVAIFDEHNEALIPLVNPSITQDIVFTTVEGTLEQSIASENVSASLISIQALENSSATLTDHTLTVNLENMVPDGYTSLHLVAKPGTFNYSLVDRVIQEAASIPLSTGTTIGALLFLLTLVWLRLITPRVTKSSDLLSTPPDSIPPLGLSIIHHSTLTASDLTALLYELAERGYLQIISHENELLFARTNNNDGLTPFEYDLLEMLFPSTAKISHLRTILQELNKELFSRLVNQLYIDTYAELEGKGYFVRNPRFVHIHYKTLAISAQVLGILVIVCASFYFQNRYAWALPIGASFYLLGWLLYHSAHALSKYSPSGQVLAQRCSQFISYLRSPAPINAAGKQGLLFYQFVPYALAAGVLPEWLHRFREESFYVPNWYTDDDGGFITPGTFVDRILRATAELSTTITAVKDPNVD